MLNIRRFRFQPVAVVLSLVLLLVPASAVAQVPQIGPPWAGSLPPPGGVALLTVSRAVSTASLSARLEQEGCAPVTLAIAEGGRWTTYIPGAPPFVNDRFPAELEAGTHFAVRCSEEGRPLTLGVEDDGRTVFLDVHDQLHVNLPSNPSTGYAWRTVGEVPASVLESLGEPTFTGPGIPGASGTMMFRFLAAGPGLVELHLVHDRPFEPDSTTAEWSVTVLVRGQQAIAWSGEVRSQPQAPPDALYLELRVPRLEEGSVPPGVGIRGSDGATTNLLEAVANTGEEVLVWGELTCGVVDYGDCRIDATVIRRTSDDTETISSPVVGWSGFILQDEGADDLFQLDGTHPVQYGVAGGTPDVEAQLMEALEGGLHVRIWGELVAPVDDVNNTRITVERLALAP